MSSFLSSILVATIGTECSHLVRIWPETSGVTKEQLQGPVLTVFWKLLCYQSVIDFEVCLWLLGCFNLSPLSRKKPGGCYRGFCSPLPGSGTQHCKVKVRSHQAGLLRRGRQSSVRWAHSMLRILSGLNRDTSFKPAPSKTHLTEPHPFSQLSGAALDSLPKQEPGRGGDASLLNAAGGGWYQYAHFSHVMPGNSITPLS